MELDAELIDITGDLSSLRFVLLQLMLKIRNADSVFSRCLDRDLRDGGRFSALLAIERHSGRGGVDHKRGGAMRAGENDIAARRLSGNGRAACVLHWPVGEAEHIPVYSGK